MSKGGRRAPPVSSLLGLVLAATLLSPVPALAQGMLRGALDPLPGADEDFSPYAMNPEPEPALAFAAPEDRPDDAPEISGPEPLPEPYRTPRRVRRDDPEPYEPLGIRTGAFLVKPSLTLRGGYDSNPQNDPVPQGSAYGRVDGRIDVESDWIRHQFRGRFEAGYTAYDKLPEENGADYAADAALRLDVRNDIRADFAFHGSLDNDTRDDPELIGISTTEQNLRLGGRAGVVYKPGRISIAPTLDVLRVDYGDPNLYDRDYTEADLRLRTGVELSPALEPFVEAAVNKRTYDVDINRGGFAHNTEGYRIYAGARFEPDPIWTAEAKIGYGRQEAEDIRLPAESGLVAEGTVIWQPSDLTRLRLSAGRTVDSTTRECCAVGSSVYARAGFDHEFRQWLILSGEAGFRQSEYFNGDRLRDFNAELELEYKLNRMMSAIGRVEYRKLESTDISDNYDSAKIEVGLRMQR